MKKQNILDLIYQFKGSCIASEQKIMSETGLTPAEYNGLAAMKPGEDYSGNEVSQKMSLSPSRASRVIDMMVKHSFLFREIDPGDRRRCTISLAPKGEELKQKIDDLRRSCERKIKRQLTTEELNSLKASLSKIMDVL